MTWRPQLLCIVTWHIRSSAEFLKDWKQPPAVIIEYVPAADIHIAEICLRSIQVSFRILQIIRILFLYDVQDTVKILPEQIGSRIVLLPDGHLTRLIPGRPFLYGHDIVWFHQISDVCISPAVALSKLFLKIWIIRKNRFIYIPISVFPVFLSGKVKIPAVMEKAQIIRLQVFPCPVLGSQFAVWSVEGRDILSLIVIQHVRESLIRQSCPDLYRSEHFRFQDWSRLMTADEDLHILPGDHFPVFCMIIICHLSEKVCVSLCNCFDIVPLRCFLRTQAHVPEDLLILCNMDNGFCQSPYRNCPLVCQGEQTAGLAMRRPYHNRDLANTGRNDRFSAHKTVNQRKWKTFPLISGGQKTHICCCQVLSCVLLCTNKVDMRIIYLF